MRWKNAGLFFLMLLPGSMDARAPAPCGSPEACIQHLHAPAADFDDAIVVIENVAGLLTSGGGADFAAVCGAMADAGYRVGALEMDAALWLAGHYELEQDALEEAGADAEAVIRAGLLWQALAPQAHEWPHAVALEKRVTALRKKKTPSSATVALPPGLPDDLRDAVQAHCASVQADVARLLDGATALRTLLRPTGAFRARYFLQDDPLAEVDDYLRRHEDVEEGAEPPQPASKTWTRATQGNEDEHALLTLFLCLATGAPKKTLLTEKTAASLVRKIRKSGLHPQLATEFIRSHAPGAHQADYCTLWNNFVQESQATLCNDRDYQLHDALALLRRECHVVG